MEEINKSSGSTLEEVKKLQDLVKKLELQNQQLRNRQNKFSKKKPTSNCNDSSITSHLNVLKYTNFHDDEVSDEGALLGKNNNIENEIEEGEITNENLNYLDEIDIIRVSDVEMSDDESWLYSSPKGLTPEQKNESPYKWLRKDVDDLENKELQLAKKALITKLNELEILSPTSQTNHQPQTFVPSNLIHRSVVTHISQPPVKEHNSYSVIDTRTFTKSRKKQALEYLSSSPVLESFHDVERKETGLYRRGSDISLDSNAGTYTLTDANDVQEVARLQEESLRLSSPFSTPKRQSSTSTTASRRYSVSSRSSVSDIDATEQPPSLNYQVSIDSTASETPPPPPTFTSLPSKTLESNSNQSSPSDSPYGSNASLDSVGRKKGEPYRSSLPNLNRKPAGLKLKKNVTNRESRQQKSFAARTGASGRRSDSNLLSVNRTQKSMPSPTRQLAQTNHYVPSSTCGTLNQEHSSKTIKINRSGGRLPVKSGLPRPTRATSATRIGSGIPMSSMNKKCEDSWSDGCF